MTDMAMLPSIGDGLERFPARRWAETNHETLQWVRVVDCLQYMTVQSGMPGESAHVTALTCPKSAR